MRYRRFDTAADAIRFAVEELPEPLLLGAYIEINEARLGHKDIRALYECDSYPLEKAAPAEKSEAGLTPEGVQARFSSENVSV